MEGMKPYTEPVVWTNCWKLSGVCWIRPPWSRLS